MTMTPFKASVDVGIGGLIIGAVMSVVPPVAAIIGLLYYAIQLWETKTVQDWIRARRQKLATKKLAKLQAKQKVILAEIAAAELVRRATAVADNKVAVAKADAATLVATTSSPENTAT